MIRPVLTAGLLLAAFSLSLFFTGYRDIIYAPAVVLLLLAAGLAVIPCFWRGCNIPFGVASLLLFALWLYITISMSWSAVPFTSMVTWLVFVSLPVTFFSLSLPQDRRTYIMATARALLGALALLGGWAIVQGAFGLYGVRAHHPLQNANDLAALLNLGLLPVLAYLIYKKDRNMAFYGAALAAVLMFGGILATQSRSGFLFAFVAALILLFLLRPPVKKSAIIFGSGMTFFIFMQLTNGWHFAGRLAQFATHDPNVISRLSLWESTLRMMRDHPWGTGLGTFYLYYPRYRVPLVENSAGFWAHSDPLQFGAETGIAATFLIYALFAAVAWRTISALRYAEKNSPHRAAAAGFACALLTLTLYAHTSFPLYLMPALIVAGVWLAAWQHVTALCLPAQKNYIPLDIAAWQRPVLALCVAGICAMIALMACSSAAGQYYLQRATAGIKQGHVAAFLDGIEKAEKWAPPAFIDPEVQVAGFYIDTMGVAGILFSGDDNKKMFDDALSLLNFAESMNPAWAEIDYKRGKLYAAVKDAGSAAAAWRAALAKNPMHTRARADLAKALVAQGRPAEAHDLLAAGLDYPHTPDVTGEYGAMMKNIAGVAQVQKSFLQKEKMP